MKAAISCSKKLVLNPGLLFVVPGSFVVEPRPSLSHDRVQNSLLPVLELAIGRGLLSVMSGAHIHMIANCMVPMKD